MDEKIYDLDKMFFAKQKDEYLKTFDNEGTQRTIAYIFYKSQPIESKLGYDLGNFSFDEIIDVLDNLDSMNRGVARTNGRFIKGYITWCIENGRRQNNIHPLKDMGTDWADEYVFSKKLYLSEQDIKDMDKDLVSQDSVILYLLFEGVWGQGLSELTNLHYNDIDWNNNILTLKDEAKDEPRQLKVSNKCMAVIERAYKDDKYNSAGASRETELVRNDYILRNALTGKTKSNDVISKHGIYRRLSNISEYYDLPYLTANNIRKSGQIKMAADFVANGEELDSERLYKIAERFGVNKVSNKGYEYYNVSILKDYINVDNINELYPNIRK